MITALTAEQRLHFYELFAHNLTVAIRGIWSEENASEAEKIERMKRVNEIMHRVTSKVYVLRLSIHEWTEEDTWKMIKEYVAEDKAIEAEVNAAIRYSYGSAVTS
jgi:Na+/phosphate symporter